MELPERNSGPQRAQPLGQLTTMATWARGQWDVKTTYASRLFKDRLSGTAGFGDAGPWRRREFRPRHVADRLLLTRSAAAQLRSGRPR